MAQDHLRSGEELAQQLLDEPNFLREVVERVLQQRVLQQLLEAEMDTHISTNR